MKQIKRQAWLTWTALLLSFPTAYFIGVNILKEVFGEPGPYDAIDPFLQQAGIREPFGWNINLLILLGPVLALVLAIFQVLQIKWEFTTDRFQLHISLRKQWFPLLVIGFSVSLLAVLFFYVVGENCNCQTL